MKLSKHIKTVDEFGIHNYRGTFLAFLAIAALYGTITIFSFLLVSFEASTPNANITTYRDAFWTLQMSASTIGFGDHFPISTGGRIIVALMFYIGVGLVGFIGALVADKIVGFANTNIKNRQLKKQNEDLLAHNIKLEQKIDLLINKVETFIEKEKTGNKNV